MTSEQQKLLSMVNGIVDQIKKEHWLNVHFRAFELACDSWAEHIRANARTGSKQARSPAGAVLDNNRKTTE